MPTVATKTLNRLRKGGVLYTKEPQPITYEQALALEDDPRLSVKITQEEHAAYHSRQAAAAEAAEDPGTQTDPDKDNTDPNAGGGQDQEPDDPVARKEAIIDAASQLDLDNEDHYTKAGLPDARALSGILGWTVTAAERNEAFGAQGGGSEDDETQTPNPEEGEKPKGKITIKKKGEGDPDPAEAGEGGGADPSTEGAVEV